MDFGFSSPFDAVLWISIFLYSLKITLSGIAKNSVRVELCSSVQLSSIGIYEKIRAKPDIYIGARAERNKRFPGLVGGSGIGSNIAETILRLGFEHITIVDGDVVEESNLNRQNYKQTDLGRPKVEA